jgi:hypothetical protein
MAKRAAPQPKPLTCCYGLPWSQHFGPARGCLWCDTPSEEPR